MKIFHHHHHHRYHVEFALVTCAERMRNTGHREKVRIHCPSCLTRAAVQCELTGGFCIYKYLHYLNKENFYIILRSFEPEIFSPEKSNVIFGFTSEMLLEFSNFGG